MLAAFNRPLPVLSFIAIALILDQAIKYAVEVTLPMHELIPVMPFCGCGERPARNSISRISASR